MEMKDWTTGISRHQLFIGVMLGGDSRLLVSPTLASLLLLLCRIRTSRASPASLSSAFSASSSASASSFSSHNSFCSVYSYNWRLANVAKDFFVCCANPSDESCHGTTYQKPSRTEGPYDKISPLFSNLFHSSLPTVLRINRSLFVIFAIYVYQN